MSDVPTTRVSNLLAGKVAIVSGIGPGLGRQAALALAAHGASRYTGDLDTWLWVNTDNADRMRVVLESFGFGFLRDFLAFLTGFEPVLPP